MAQDIVVKYDCRACANYPHCEQPCIYVDNIIDGNHPSKEPLISNMLGDNREIHADRNYEDILSELQDDRTARIDYAMSIGNYRVRAISVMLLACIPRDIICSLLSVSYRTLSRYIHDNNELREITSRKLS
jgi:hypothetical protein